MCLQPYLGKLLDLRELWANKVDCVVTKNLRHISLKSTITLIVIKCTIMFCVEFILSEVEALLELCIKAGLSV